ncbi:substrate-binding periplasmic protein [Undibacterium sp. Ji50W]|uniref:substrate-binding periplasmic protein n=1 Tax=Undibacterium sp. Ji50W TaxID=3413041 RepID=UPI003BF10EDA
MFLALHISSDYVRRMAGWHTGLGKVVPGLLQAMLASCFCVLLCASPFSYAGQAGLKSSLKYFPVGPIYEYRWKLLELALAHTRDEAAHVGLEPFAEDVTQNRGISLLQSGVIDVIALGTNTERETQMLPIKIDILRGIIGYRVLVIRKADQASIALMDEQALRQQLTFGLNSQWADLAILRANGFTVVTSTNYENLFGMLAAGRFDAFTRGLNEAYLEIEKHKAQFPQLMTEKSKALYFPYPVYFWVNKDNKQLASRIERGLKLALADGSFRQLFESYHAKEIKQLASERRQVIKLANPVLPAGTLEPDTRWWWH